MTTASLPAEIRADGDGTLRVRHDEDGNWLVFTPLEDGGMGIDGGEDVSLTLDLQTWARIMVWWSTGVLPDA